MFLGWESSVSTGFRFRPFDRWFLAMDFRELIDIAAKNRVKKPESKACYQTKFQPPKKEAKKEKTLSENIKKFLARKEEEEKLKALEEKKKRDVCCFSQHLHTEI